MSDEILLGISNKKPKRHRATKTGLVDRRAALLEIVRNAQPATVRQIFYLASVRRLVAKDEGDIAGCKSTWSIGSTSLWMYRRSYPMAAAPRNIR